VSDAPSEIRTKVSTSPPAGASEDGEYNAKVLWSLARWIEDKKGKDALADVASASEIDPAWLDGSTHWLMWERVERFLAKARELAADDQDFLEACGHRFFESMGPVRYMVWSLSEQQFFEGAVKMSKLMVKAGRFEKTLSRSGEFHVRYTSEHPESRLMCLSRQASWINGPTMWGMPRAQLTEKACIGNGDDHCEYHLKWFARRRLLPIVIGILAGAAASFALHKFMQEAALPSLALPFLGAALGYIYELRRAQGVNLELAESMNGVLRELGTAEAEARSELGALDRRQREWLRLMEEQMAQRTNALEKVVDGLEGFQATRASTLKGFSHDLRNPLFVMKGNVQYLVERVRDVDVLREEKEALVDMESAVAQMEQMLSRLMDVALQGPGLLKLQPKPLVTAPLGDLFRRRLRALVYGRDIKVTSFVTREAPTKITIDPLVFDRIVDNLLTNAAKYTRRGSIVIELGGTPGPDGTFLTLKISDTGEGISQGDIARIFRPRTAEEPRRANSYGVGLSSVVQLMAQIGGRIDVMSREGTGSTFWAHFPETPPSPRKSAPENENLESIITRVVTIRKAEGT
jgi:signal transduction histidine kinase